MVAGEGKTKSKRAESAEELQRIRKGADALARAARELDLRIRKLEKTYTMMGFFIEGPPTIPPPKPKK